MRGWDTGLYLPYFLITLTAALTRSLARGVLVAAAASAVYVFLVWREGDAAGLLDVHFLIRLPFFFIIAMFTGFLAQAARAQQEAVDASRALADQVESLQQLAAGIAHEVRNPLTAISNNLRTIQSRLPESGAERAIVRDALVQVARMTRIVQETLELARPPAVRPGWVEVNGLVDRAAREALSGDRAGRITLRLRLFPRPLTVWADAQLLEQGLGNILRNAAEAMAQGGSLDVETALLPGGGRDAVVVRVTDSGGGIPDHQLERLFQPFYTTKAGGTGLGLCLARKYVRAHGGDLTVASPVEAESGGARGTSVHVWLPVTGPLTAGRAAVEAAA
jgi:signal transduction histidine kinase